MSYTIGHEPSPKDNNVELLFEFASLDVLSKLERARATDIAMDKDGLSNSRQYLIRSGGSEVLPMPHVRIGLQPSVRRAPQKGIVAATIRVPMMDSPHAPSILKDLQKARIQAGNEPISTKILPTKDLFVEIVTSSGESGRFLFTDLGILAYDDGGDIVFNGVESADRTGRMYDIQPSLSTTQAQQELLAMDISADTVASLLSEYELFPQDNTRRLQLGSPDSVA